MWLILGACAWLTAAIAVALPPPAALPEMAAALVDAAAAPGGIAVVVSPRGGDLAPALACQGSFTVQALCGDRGACERARAAIAGAGLYGHVSARQLSGRRLPYTSNLVAVTVVETGLGWLDPAMAGAEVYRTATPLGSVFVTAGDSTAVSTAQAAALAASFLAAGGREEAVVAAGAMTWRHLRKPWPEEMDDWPHYLHGADGNPVVRDRLVGPPARTQWISGPTWLRSHDSDSSVSTVVTARGRLFAIVDLAPISLVGQHALPDRWSLVARDAFSGVLLWDVPIRRWGWREWKSSWFNTRPGDIPLNLQKRLVATPDRVYVTLGSDAPVSELDARTGAQVRSFAGSEGTREILWRDGILFLSVPEGRRVRLKAFDAASGRSLWSSAATYRGSTVDYIKWTEGAGAPVAADLDPTLNTATDGRIVALIDGPDVVATDAGTGVERWRTSFPADPADRGAGGTRNDGSLWVGTMIVTDGVVIHASPGCLAALDAADGRVLWRQPKKYIGHLWYEWKDVFVIDGLVWTWSAELEPASFDAGGRAQRVVYPTAANGYDVRTGEVKRQVPLGPTFKAYHHHRCYRNKATSRFILASRRGTECIDLEGGAHTVDNWVRGTCHLGMVPANGLLYAPPHPCACYIEEKLNGFLALGPDDGASQPEPAATRLERGPAFGTPLPFPAVDPAQDWPEFRHDGARTGAVQAALPTPTTWRWRVPVGGRLSAPVAAGGGVFLAQPDAHDVLCLDAAAGHVRWSFTAGGRVDSPPTVTDGRVLFGAADGWVYCLRAADGQLQWRFQAAPEDRQVAVTDQLESAWPVHGSVLVREGTAYVVAGRSSHLDGGLYLYGLDAATGRVVCQRRIEGPAYTSATIDQNHRLAQGLLPDILVAADDGIAMRTARFDRQLNPAPGRVPLQTRAGYLDDSYFKRTPWTMNGEHARLLVHDDRSVYYVRMFDSLKCLDPSVYFTPGAQGYLLFAKNMKGAAATWSMRVPIRVRAMALTPEQLVVAGPPDRLAADDPLGPFEGRAGGILLVVQAVTGARQSELTLPSAPVFNGIAAARGLLFLALEDGTVACLGAP